MSIATEDEVKVVFRAWKRDGAVIAIFPYLLGNDNPSTCLSYEHLGQHGAATEALVQAHTWPAKPEQYAALRRELEVIGYRLKVITRIPHGAYRARWNAIHRPAA